MKSLNKIQLLGNVGRDPEIKYTTSGKAVANFSIATNDRYKDSAGEWQDRAEWHNVVAWERLAEIVRDYVIKGNQVYVEGRSQTRSYDKDGEKKYVTEVVARDLILCGGGGRNPPGSGSEAPAVPDSGTKKDDFPF